MHVDLSDPAVTMAYQSVINNEPVNWLLLSYERELDSVALFATGRNGLDEMKGCIGTIDNVFIGLVRESFNGKNRFALIVYIPESTSGVKRARALVLSRNVGAVFNARQVTLTVSNLDKLTLDVISQALVERFQHYASTRSTSTEKALPNPEAQDVYQSMSEVGPMVRASSPLSKSASLPPKGGVFSSFLRRKKPRSINTGQPPPTPPKDIGAEKFTTPSKEPYTPGLFATGPNPPSSMSTFTNHEVASMSHVNRPTTPPIQTRRNSLSDFVHISNFPPADEMEQDEIVLEPDLKSSVPQDPIGGSGYSSVLQRKWRQDSSVHLSPAEKVQRRVEAQRKMQEEEAAAMREEADRQAELKLRRQELQLQEEEDDERRRAQAMEEAKQIVAQRARKTKQQKEDEERKTRELRERKHAEHERRLEESRKMEKWRREQAKIAEEDSRKKKELEMAAEEERRSKIKQVEAKIKKSGTEIPRTGWVTVQTNEALTWKRRYFKFNGDTMVLYRSPKDIHQVMDSINLRGRVSGLKEWYQGYEELESIPFSFAVDFKDGQGSWSMFADSEEEKVKILGFLHQAAGLKTY